MMRGEPIIITRNQVAQWASFIGGTGLLLGVLGYIWQGGFSDFIAVSLVIGVLGIGLWAVMTPQEFMGFVSGRQARYGTTAVFSTLILVGIVALAFVILQRAVITVDMTADQRFTLGSVTEGVLRRVTRDIQITGFYSAESLLLREQDDQFFRLYEVATNGRIHRQYIDPDEQPGIEAAFEQRFGVITDGDVFISYLTPDGEADIASAARVPRGERQERDMTGAIARLLVAGTLTVYFETSHGEINPLEQTQQGLSGIHAGIQESGLITAELKLSEMAAGETIPANASTVIMARPITDLSNEEITVIDEYLQRGGSLLIMADVLLNDSPFLGQNSAFNQYLWDNYGIRALDAIVVDSAASGATDIDVIGAAVATGTDLGGRLDPASAPTLFRIARALEVQQDSPPTDNGWVIASSQQSYGETDIQSLMTTNTYTFDAEQDITGPLNIAVWSWDQETNARILLVGDSDFATNGYVCEACPIGNAILFTDGISWLSGLNEQLDFGFRSFVTAPLIFVSGQMLDVIAFITIIIIPGLVLATGIVIWRRRNRR